MAFGPRIFNKKQSMEREVKDLYLKCAMSQDPATAELATSEPIILTSVVEGSTRNTNTLTLEVEAAAANPTDTVLADVTGTASAIVITITPNNGVNNPDAAATGSLNLTNDITLTSVVAGTSRNTDTFTLEVEAAAANPSNTVLADFTGTADAIVCTITPNDGTNNPGDAAVGTLNLTADIILTSVAAGAARNTNTFTLEVLAAAANPTDTILADFTGTAAAIVCTITPNDGTNNGATPVDLTTAELAELINTGAVVGKTVTVTDASSLRNDQTATGGDATALANAGEGDGVVATFSGGTNISVGLTTAELSELINTGAVSGKTVTVTDASSLRNDQTSSGGGATALANAGEGDGVIATFSGGTDIAVDLTTEELVELINSGTVVGKTVTVTDASSLLNDQTAEGGDSTPLANSGEGDGEVATFTGGGSPNPTILSGIGISSIVRNDTGDYTITLEDKYFDLKYFRGMILRSSEIDARIQLHSETIDSDKKIRFYILQGATKIDLPDDSQVLFKIENKNSGGF